MEGKTEGIGASQADGRPYGSRIYRTPKSKWTRTDVRDRSVDLRATGKESLIGQKFADENLAIYFWFQVLILQQKITENLPVQRQTFYKGLGLVGFSLLGLFLKK